MSAMVEITFRCSGCGATHDAGKHHIARFFRSFSGRDYGFGSWYWKDMPNPAELFPDGWAKDPYTSADYCPKCADEIWPESAAALPVEEEQ